VSAEHLAVTNTSIVAAGQWTTRVWDRLDLSRAPWEVERPSHIRHVGASERNPVHGSRDLLDIWDTHTREHLYSFTREGSAFDTRTVCVNQDYLIAGTVAGALDVVDLTTGARAQTLRPPHQGEVRAIAVVDDVVVSADDDVICVSDLTTTGALLSRLELPSRPVTLALGDGFLATPGHKAQVHLWAPEGTQTAPKKGAAFLSGWRGRLSW